MSYIRRKYNRDGSYLINLKGGRKMRVPPFYGGNCGCSNCLSGSGFFDEVNKLLPTALGFVPGVGSVLQGTAQGVLNALRPPEDNTPPPVHYSPLVEKQTGQYTSNQYQQAIANANKNPPRMMGTRMSGSGVVDFISRNKWELAPLALGTVMSLAKIFHKDKIPKVPAKLVGSGIKDFWNKHKNKIIPLGVASVGALAGLLYHGSKNTAYKPQTPVYSEYTVEPRAGYILPFSSETGNYDYLDKMEGSGFVDWVKKNKKPLLGVLGTVGALGATTAGLHHLGSKTMNLNPDLIHLRGNGLFGDVVSGALKGAISGVPAMISKHQAGETMRNLQNRIKVLENR